MNGNIVAMHTQGYHLERNEWNIPDHGNIPNQEEENITNQQQEYVQNWEQGNIANQQQENIPNQEQEKSCRGGNLEKYSLMEFGVQFISICEDLRKWRGENFVKQIFPNYE